MEQQDIKRFRTLSGTKRRDAMRTYLQAAPHGIRFGMGAQEITARQQAALAEMAKAVGWRKGMSARLPLGMAFYVYLSREVVSVPQESRQHAGPIVVKREPRRSFFFGRNEVRA